MPLSGSTRTAQLLNVQYSSLLKTAAGSCFREFFALQRHGVLTEQGKKVPEAAGHSHFSL
jgi:hypothetical protein